MKNLYLILVLFSGFCFSQNYHFDILTKYQSKDAANKYSSDLVNYYNTSDYTYTLSLAKSDVRFVGLLIDRGRNLTHYFTVYESREKGEVQFRFQYNFTQKRLVRKNAANYLYDLSPPSAISPKELTLRIFKNKKSKKPLLEQKLTVQEADSNLFPIYRETFLAHYPSDQVISAN